MRKTMVQSTSFVCGACAAAPVARDGMASHLNCPGAGEPGPFRGCDCARNEHQPNKTILTYQMKYCHLDEEELEYHWETGKRAQPSGDSVPVGADTVRRRRLVITEIPEKSTDKSTDSDSRSALERTATKSPKGNAKDAEQALAAFTGHKVGKP